MFILKYDAVYLGRIVPTEEYVSIHWEALKMERKRSSKPLVSTKLHNAIAQPDSDLQAACALFN